MEGGAEFGAFKGFSPFSVCFAPMLTKSKFLAVENRWKSYRQDLRLIASPLLPFSLAIARSQLKRQRKLIVRKLSN